MALAIEQWSLELRNYVRTCKYSKFNVLLKNFYWVTITKLTSLGFFFL